VISLNKHRHRERPPDQVRGEAIQEIELRRSFSWIASSLMLLAMTIETVCKPASGLKEAAFRGRFFYG
jgi:hypothetical protein